MFIVSRPEPMLRVRIITTRDNLDEALRTLQELGIVHVEESKIPGEKAQEIIEKQLRELQELQAITEELIQYLPPGTVAELRAEFAPSRLREILSELGKHIREVHSKVVSIVDNVSALEKEIDDLRSKLEIYKDLSLRLGDVPLNMLSYKGKIVETTSWILPSKEAASRMFKELEKYASAIFECTLSTGREFITLTYLTHVSDIVKGILNKYGAQYFEVDVQLGSLEKAVSEYSRKLDELSSLVASLRNNLRDLVIRSKDAIALLKILLENELCRIEALKMAIESKFISVVEGWVPAASKEQLEYRLRDKLKAVYIEYEEPGYDVEPPVKLKNLSPFRPFEVLTKLYGIPRYKEWDPTPLLAYSFSLFFGLMLGDLGYGLALVLASIYALPKLVEDPTSEGFRKFQKLLVATGLSAMVFGALSGSFFGNLLSFLLPPPVLELTNPIVFIGLALMIGLFHVNIAHVLACIRGFIDKNLGLAISELGLLIAQIGGVPYILETLLGIKVPFIPQFIKPYLVYIAIAGLAMLVFGKFKAMGGLGGMMWLFDLTGLLGDVMSYSRLAGVGLATYYLAYSFNTMINMVITGLSSSLPGIAGLIAGGLAGLILLAMTHILNLAMSSLGAFVHSMRLCFVEFMPKFYSGGGREFMPLRVVIRTRVMLRAR